MSSSSRPGLLGKRHGNFDPPNNSVKMAGTFELISRSLQLSSNEAFYQDHHNKEPALKRLESMCKKRLDLDGTYFTPIWDRPAGENAVNVRCNFCGVEFTQKFMGRRATTPHLEKHHPDQFKAYNEMCDQLKKKPTVARKQTCTPKKSDSQESIRRNQTINESTHDSQKSIRRKQTIKESTHHSQESINRQKIINFFINSMALLSAVEGKDFRTICDPTIGDMTEAMLSSLIKQTFEEYIENIRKKVAKIEYVCATVDAWSGNNGRFLGVTLHWMDEETHERQSAAIALKSFPAIHSQQATTIHKSYNLTPVMTDATVTDTESNFVKDFKEHGLEALDRLFSVERSVNVSTMTHIVEDFSTPARENTDFFKQCQKMPQHVRCASHTLNNVANTDIINVIELSADLKEIHSKVLAKCDSLWESLRLPTMNETLKRRLGTELIKPISTGWKSLFDALKKLVTLKDKILTYSSENPHGITLKDAFAESDFGYLEEYITSTMPLATAIDQLEDKTRYYGHLLPILVKLRQNLQVLSGKPEVKICKPLVVGIIKALETRFKNMFEVSDEGIAAAIASISLPAYKKSWRICLNKEKEDLAHCHVISAVSARIPRDTLPRMEDVDSDDLNFGTVPHIDQDAAARSTAHDLVVQYTTDLDKKLDKLKKHPVMQKMFREFNAPLLSSAPVEHLFGDVTTMDLSKFNPWSDCRFELRVLRNAAEPSEN